MRRTVADGVNDRIRGPQLIVDHDTATLRIDLQYRLPGQFVPWADPRRKDDHPGDEGFLAIAAGQSQPVAVAVDSLRAGAGDGRNPFIGKSLFQMCGRFRIQLTFHQVGARLHQGHVEPPPVERFGRLDAEQSATHDHGAGHGSGVRTDLLQIVKRAVDKHPIMVRTLDRRAICRCPRGQNEAVIGDAQSSVRVNRAVLAVDGRDPFAGEGADSRCLAPTLASKGQLVEVPMVEPLGEMDAIVDGIGFIADERDLEPIQRVQVGKSFHQLQCDHPEADDDQTLRMRGRLGRFCCDRRSAQRGSGCRGLGPDPLSLQARGGNGYGSDRGYSGILALDRGAQRRISVRGPRGAENGRCDAYNGPQGEKHEQRYRGCGPHDSGHRRRGQPLQAPSRPTP